MNNKILLFVLVGLLGIYGLSKVLSSNGERSFDPNFLSVDAGKATKVVLKTKADNQEEAVLKKEGDSWTLTKNGKTYPAAQAAIDGFFTNLNSAKADHITAKSSDKWAEYELEDGAASHVTVYGGNQKLADFYVGKFSVNQQARQITSFMRTSGSDNIYAVVGTQGMTLGQGSDAYRDKKLLDLDMNDIESLKMEGDTPYQVTKTGNEWMLDNSTPLDSNTVRNFLMNLQNMSGETFVDDFDEVLKGDNLLKTLTISGSNMETPVTVRCWTNEGSEKPFVVQSSEFPTSYFESDSTRLFTRVFKPISDW